MSWTLTSDGTGYVCTRHGTTFARAEVCHECASDPGDGPGEIVESEDLDRKLLALANEFRGAGRVMWREAKSLLEDGTAQDKNTAAKLSAEAVKWQRLALELEDKVSARDHDRKLIRHEREMSALRGTH